MFYFLGLLHIPSIDYDYERIWYRFSVSKTTEGFNYSNHLLYVLIFFWQNDICEILGRTFSMDAYEENHILYAKTEVQFQFHHLITYKLLDKFLKEKFLLPTLCSMLTCRIEHLRFDRHKFKNPFVFIDFYLSFGCRWHTLSLFLVVVTLIRFWSIFRKRKKKKKEKIRCWRVNARKTERFTSRWP